MPYFDVDAGHDVISLASSLTFDSMDAKDYSCIVEAIKKIPIDQRKEMCKRVIPFLQQNASGSERGDLLVAISEIPNENRDEVLNIALNLIPQDMLERGMTAVLKQLSSIVSNRRQEVIQQALRLWAHKVPQTFYSEHKGCAQGMLAHLLKIVQSPVIPQEELELRVTKALAQLDIDYSRSFAFPMYQSAYYPHRAETLLTTPLDCPFFFMREYIPSFARSWGMPI